MEIQSYEELVGRAGEERLEGEAAYTLARFALADPGPAMRAAATVRDRLFGPRVSYSRKVFIPLTKLCRDNCGYCTFAQAPRPGERAYLTLEEVRPVTRTVHDGVAHRYRGDTRGAGGYPARHPGAARETRPPPGVHRPELPGQ